MLEAGVVGLVCGNAKVVVASATCATCCTSHKAVVFCKMLKCFFGSENFKRGAGM